MKYTIIGLFLFLSTNMCHDTKKVSEKKLQNNVEYANILIELVDVFDYYLEKEYDTISEQENQVYLFLNRITKVFTSDDYKIKRDEIVKDLQVFNSVLKELDSSTFFVTQNQKEKLEVIRWKDSIRKMYELEWNDKVDNEIIPVINPLIKKDYLVISDTIKYHKKLINDEFYFEIYKGTNINDIITRKWIEGIIVGPGKSETYSILHQLQKTKNKKLLTESSIKLLIISEFIIPYYDFLEKRIKV